MIFVWSPRAATMLRSVKYAVLDGEAGHALEDFAKRRAPEPRQLVAGDDGDHARRVGQVFGRTSRP